MPWLQLDDVYDEDLRVEALSDAAFRLHHAGLYYCARNSTDGFLPAGRAERLTLLPPRAFKKALAELTDSPEPFWRPIAIPGDPLLGYDIPDFLGRHANRTAERVDADRQRTNARKQRQRNRQNGTPDAP